MEAIDSRARQVTVSTGLGSEGQIEIRVGDSGARMRLAVCRSIVERHGGQIWAEDGDGSGALFHVDLPSAQHETQNGN